MVSGLGPRDRPCGWEQVAASVVCRTGSYARTPGKRVRDRYPVKSVYEDHQGTLWLGTDGHGLERIENGIASAYTTKEGLSNDTVSAIMEDDEGSLWLGTFGGGLVRLKDANFITYGMSKD